jgi:hypothetical protein
MATVIVSCYKVAKSGAGGHFWVYMQYVQALRRAGCDVYWMEQFRPGDDDTANERALAAFFERANAFGLEGKVLLYRTCRRGAPREWLGVSAADALATLRRADLLLNFHYAIDPELLASCGRTALVDIDPGLSQVWISTGQLSVAPHDFYFTIGETVGTPGATFPDCGIRWIYSPPPVCLELWPVASDPACRAFTTVSGWWSGKWIKLTEGDVRENTKRAAFLPFVDLPCHTGQPLELALDLADGDAEDRRLFESHGWRIRHAREVARTPEMYQAYIQRSRGEFSCVKPSCVQFQNAWVSDRTICYLASGKPVVVQDTGPSAFLPNGEGLFRFTTVAEAAAALETVNADYERHCRAARELAEAHFDSKKVVARILDVALARAGRATGVLE